MFDYLDADDFDPHLNENQLKLANDMQKPTAQLGCLIRKAENDLLNKFHGIDEELDNVIKLYVRDFRSNFADLSDVVEKKYQKTFANAMSPSEVLSCLVEYYQSQSIMDYAKGEDYEFSIIGIIAYGYIILEDYEIKWHSCLTDKDKLKWYMQFNSRFYSFFDCYLIAKEKEVEIKTKSMTNRKKAKSRHEKSNKTKEKVLSLAADKQNKVTYKSRAQLTDSLLKEARLIANLHGWQPSNDHAFYSTIYKWLSDEAKANKP